MFRYHDRNQPNPYRRVVADLQQLAEVAALQLRDQRLGSVSKTFDDALAVTQPPVDRPGVRHAWNSPV